jgi:hypothetical protein
MAIAFRASALLNDDSSNQPNSISGTIPGSAQAGDMALLTCVLSTGSYTVATPAGWTRLDGPTRINSNLTAYLFARKLTAGQAGTTVTLAASSGARFIGLLGVYSGVDTIAELVTTVDTHTSAATSITSPAITTPEANCLLVNLWAVRSNTATPPTVTAPAGHTAGAEVNTDFAAAPNYAIRSTRKAIATAGPQAAATATVSQSATAVVYSVVLTPAATNTAPTVNAGADQTAVEPWSTVTLTGTASDPDGTIVAKGWTQTGGTPTVTLTGDSTTVSFEAPATTAGTTLTFTYSATDNAGATSTDSVTVAVLQATEFAAVGGVYVPVRFVEVTGPVIDPELPPVPIDTSPPLQTHEWTMWARGADYSIIAALPILSAEFVKKHMGVDAAVCKTSFTPENWNALQPSGGVVLFRDGRQEFTGRLTAHQIDWDADEGRAVILIEAQGDERGLAGRLVFPDPLRAADDQTVNDYWRSTGVATSTAMLKLISDQAGPTCRSDRRLPGLELGDDPGVGVVRAWAALFVPVLDQLVTMSVASGANLGLRVTSEASSLEFTIYEPRDVSERIVFSADLSNLLGFSFREEAPEVTDAVAAGQGDLHLRLRRKATTADPLALAWGEQQWTYIDRRDTADSTELTQEATDAVTEGAPKLSLTVTLTDSQAATYGRDWGLGDKVTVYVGLPGQEKAKTVTDVVREIHFEVEASGKETIRPAIGSFGATAVKPTATQRRLSAVGGALGNLIARK